MPASSSNRWYCGVEKTYELVHENLKVKLKVEMLKSSGSEEGFGGTIAAIDIYRAGNHRLYPQIKNLIPDYNGTV